MSLNRSELRKKIMTILYQINVYENSKISYELNEVIREIIDIDNEFVKDIVYGVTTYKGDLREIANTYLSGWTIDRLGNTDQAILLMSIYEMLYTDTPAKVVINEAVNLAKDYSDDKVKNMINAALDRIYHERILNE